MTILDESSDVSVSEVPKSHFSVPWGGEEIVVVVGQSQITDEVRVSSEALNGLAELAQFFWSLVEFPDQDGFVSGGGDQDLSVFVLLLGMASFDGSDPVWVAGKVANFGAGDLWFNVSHPQIN